MAQRIGHWDEVQDAARSLMPMEVSLLPRSHTALGGCGGCRVRAQSNFVTPSLLLLCVEGA